MEIKASKKVPGGKLLRITVTHNDGLITAAKITGDFFLHPEEKISELETLFHGMNHHSTESEYKEKTEQFLKKQNITLIGISSHDIAETFLKAFKTNPVN